METIPISPVVDSFSSSTPYDAKRRFIERKKYYLRKASILQESYEVYQSGTWTGIYFTMRDYGVRDIHQIGFTLVVETNHHTYAFQRTFSSVTYKNDNQFGIHIVDLQRIPISKCYLIVDWVLYSGIPVQYQETSKIKIVEQFERPKKQDLEYMRTIDNARIGCASRAAELSSKKTPFLDSELPTAWKVYSELAGPFSEISKIVEYVKQNCQFLHLDEKFDGEQTELMPVPISCYFDKGFYSTVYYAQNYPIIEKRFSGGKSAVQCVVGVNKEHLDVLLYLFYCTIEQRKYYQYMTDDQVTLQRFLEENHPVVRLRKKLENIAEQFPNSSIVLKSAVYQEAQSVVSEYFAGLKAAREDAFNELARRKQTHGQWVNEYKLFTLVRVIFPDAEYQYSAEWLEHQVIDIFIPSINCAIEYQGEQHYQAVDYFGGEEKLAEQEHMDKLKREKCLAQGVSLLEWPYSLQMHMPSVCTFLRGSAPEELFDDIRIENQIAAFPVDSLSEFLNITKKRQATIPTHKQPKVSKDEIRKYDVAGKYIRSYSSVSEAAEKENLSIGGINKVIYGERKTAGGFQWKRCEVNSPKNNIAAIER